MPISDTILGKLDLKTATQQESVATRNLLPPEPWQPIGVQKADDIARWVESRLRAGMRNSPAMIVNAKKPSQGIRPVPVVGIGERVAIRALTNLALAEISPPARSMEDYKRFVLGPIDDTFTGNAATPAGIRRARWKYVVETDITAFYQYVDHEILRQEIELQTGMVHEARALIEALGEIQNAAFGLPQLIDSSDRLSEIYIAIMERDLVRQGLQVWRYNDDFRIGAASYAAAQNSLERVAASARTLGLTIGENKTFIYRTMTYFMRYATTTADDEDAHIDPAEFDPNADYEDLNDEERLEKARDELSRLDLEAGQPGRMNLAKLTVDDLRTLRKSLGTLAKYGDESALGRVTGLFLYGPSLTPRLIEYLIAVSDANVDEVMDIWKGLTDDHGRTLSDWQKIWLTYLLREIQIPANDISLCNAWLSAQLKMAENDLFHAELSLALAEQGAIEFSDLDIALRVRAEAVAPWYLLAMRELISSGNAEQNRIQAVKSTSPFYKLILES
ncbi:RNA-directed DNA polymerase [Amycolatopsis sp. MtRt-6]|uniref:RNA-directed DNA polymerase n=1 Tax=Amycolatopsis sp. MtRt-6 TaxID=2792782 RepID=UPI001A8D4328|nr:RNA-directed DNA polymerase [Amycolatopsis sp. MtRt-6]